MKRELYGLINDEALIRMRLNNGKILYYYNKDDQVTMVYFTDGKYIERMAVRDTFPIEFVPSKNYFSKHEFYTNIRNDIERELDPHFNVGFVFHLCGGILPDRTIDDPNVQEGIQREGMYTEVGLHRDIWQVIKDKDITYVYKLFYKGETKVNFATEEDMRQLHTRASWSEHISGKTVVTKIDPNDY